MKSNPTASRLYSWLVIGCLTLFFGAVNWHWLQANVVTYGWDRMDHLITSLAYTNIFQALSPSSLFDALAFADYYPPLFHFGVVAAYKLFGVNEDIAAMTNVLYVALLLGATWYVAKRVGGNGVATLATVIIGTFPMIYIMSRYLYLDFALTAMVAVTLALLLATERFTRRVPSLLFGLALGLTFLVKWTAAAFLAAPLLYMLWRSGVLVGLFRHPTALRPNLKRLVIAFGISLVLIAVWLIPARAQVEANLLGWWLFSIFVGLLGFVVYALLTSPTSDGAGRGTQDAETTTHPPTPSSEGEEGQTPFVSSPVPLGRGTATHPVDKALVLARIANALSAGAVGAFVMGLWYMVNSEFIAGFFYTAYGREEGRFLAFDKYLYEVVTEQIGPFYALVLILSIGAWLLRYIPSRLKGEGSEQINSPFSFLLSLSDTTWILLLWAIVPYIVFSAGVSLAHSRFLMPFLPPLAIAMAAGLWAIRNTAVRVGAIAIVSMAAFGQFALLSFDSLAGWRDAFMVNTHTGTANLLAHGFFIQYPADGDTDPSYAIATDILDVAEQARLAQGREFINVGVLVNSHQLHEKHFLYQIYIHYPHVLLRELARNWSENPAYSQIFEMDYVLVSDTHSYRTSAESQAVIERLLYDESDLFNQAFQPIQSWAFLSGENVTLYERRFAPTTPGAVVEDYQAVVQAIGGEIGAGDELLLVAPDQAYMVGLTFPDGTGAKFTTMPEPTTLGTFERVWLLSHNANQSDPNGDIEGWLRSSMIAGGDQWFNAVRVTPFIRATLPDAPDTLLNATWENGTVLTGVATQTSPHAITARLFWNSPDTANQKVSLQLLAADGTLIAQQDADLVNGAQSFALLIPRAASEMDYRLVVALYNPDTVERYILSGGGDVVELP
jgi:4-amino-4-deoxy-L-arabinose transferase-like glycosyltransferase